MIALAVIIIVSAGTFYGGIVYQKSQNIKARGNFASRGVGQQNLAGRQSQFGQNGARPVSGQIISMDDKGITVKLKDGSSKNVIFADSTVYNKITAGAKTDLTQGSEVTILGSQNSDNSITAQSVQIGTAVQK